MEHESYMKGHMYLWSFRRCPYAMRARMALDASGLRYEHREILLRDKPQAMLEDSAKGTVPIFVIHGRVIDESLDIMRYALSQNDPCAWLEFDQAAVQFWIDQSDAFKPQLDRYKYATRYEDDTSDAFPKCLEYLSALNDRLSQSPFLLGAKESLADVALFPFVRQFHNTDQKILENSFSALLLWLNKWVQSERFIRIMQKFPLYTSCI